MSNPLDDLRQDTLDAKKIPVEAFRAAGLPASPIIPARCACVHHDAYECARIRDGWHACDDDDYHRRECECSCHDNDDFYQDDFEP